ncbi:MAG: CsgG/HfaB family protein [Treponema sp.]|nr:CsgG/HfaB family protein [Treponema sp.]
MKKRLCGMCLLVFAAVTAAFGEEVSLERAVKNAQRVIEARLTQGTQVAVFSFQDTAQLPAGAVPTVSLSVYVPDRLYDLLTNSGFLDVINRENLALVHAEADYQLSGNVSDREAARYGREAGVQSVITGKITTVGERYQLNVRVINVESVRSEASYITYLTMDAQLERLLGITAVRQREKRERAAQREADWAERQRTQNLRFVIGAGLGAAFMFSPHAGDVLYSDDYDYDDDSAIGFNGLFFFGMNRAHTGALGLRLEASLTLNEGNTTTAFDKTDASERSVIEFSYHTLDLGLLLDLGFNEQIIVFTVFLGPYITVPISELHLSMTGETFTKPTLNPLFGPFINVGGLAGLSLGVKVGLYGYISVNVRFKYDFFDTKVKASGFNGNTATALYHRMGVPVALCYEFWL